MAIKTYTIKNKQGEVLGELHFDPLSEMTVTEASAPSAVKYTGMPHSSTGYHESKLERNVVRIQERKEHLERMIQQRNRLEQFIDNVPDAFIRYVLTLRFIENMSWKEVAYTAGAGNTEDSVKKRCCRYLKGSEDDEQEKGATTEV